MLDRWLGLASMRAMCADPADVRAKRKQRSLYARDLSPPVAVSNHSASLVTAAPLTLTV